MEFLNWNWLPFAVRTLSQEYEKSFYVKGVARLVNVQQVNMYGKMVGKFASWFGCCAHFLKVFFRCFLEGSSVWGYLGSQILGFVFWRLFIDVCVFKVFKFFPGFQGIFFQKISDCFNVLNYINQKHWIVPIWTSQIHTSDILPFFLCSLTPSDCPAHTKKYHNSIYPDKEHYRVHSYFILGSTRHLEKTALDKEWEKIIHRTEKKWNSLVDRFTSHSICICLI